MPNKKATVFTAKSPDFRTALIRHEQVLFAQAQQSAACNASHTVEARLSRWLLRSRDLSGSDTLALTQEFLPQMLSVQRSSVSLVANTLQQARLIRYSRGHFEILNLEGLQDASVAVCQERSAFGWNSGAKSALAVCSAKGVEYGCE